MVGGQYLIDLAKYGDSDEFVLPRGAIEKVSGKAVIVRIQHGEALIEIPCAVTNSGPNWGYVASLRVLILTILVQINLDPETNEWFVTKEISGGN